MTQGMDDQIVACYTVLHLGLLCLVKLTMYVIRPIVYEVEVLGREYKLLTKDQFRLLQEVERGARMVLKDVKKAFLQATSSKILNNFKINTSATTTCSH